jgi:branched-chain amino acid transport system ATP-binding protein
LDAEAKSRSAAMTEPILRVENVSKRFGGLLAVNDASFTAEPGRITALIGPNGAGKTTLFSIVSGFQPPSSGCVIYEGNDITGEPPNRLARRGIARTFQIVQPFAGLSVRENIAVGAHLSRPSRAAALAAADEVARTVGLDGNLDQPAAALTVAGRKRLELARALAIGPRLLLLDEVLAGLNPSEVRDMMPVIRGIVERGVTIVMIEHVMQAVMSLAAHVFVLSEGQIIAAGAPQEVAADTRVIEAYLGQGAAKRMAAGGQRG